MSQVSDLQMNSKIISEEETSAAKSTQTPDASGVNVNSMSPRRKISVYCRSFDLMTMQDPHESQESMPRQLSCDQPTQVNEKNDENIVKDQNNTFKYSFSHAYRNVKSDSDSSTNSTPQKQSRDSLLENETSMDQSIRKIRLAPTRLKFLQKVKSELDKTTEVSDRASSAAEFPVLAISSSPLSSIVNGGEKCDSAVRSSSMFIIDECETEVMFKSKFPDKNFFQKHPHRSIRHNHLGKYLTI